MAMPRPRGIQSVTQSRVNVYTRGDNWSCVPVNSCMYSTKSSLNMFFGAQEVVRTARGISGNTRENRGEYLWMGMVEIIVELFI